MTAELAEHAGERVVVAGWVHHQRHLAHVSFLILRDASGIGPVVVHDEAVRESATRMLPETVIEVDAMVVAAPPAPGGSSCTARPSK